MMLRQKEVLDRDETGMGFNVKTPPTATTITRQSTAVKEGRVVFCGATLLLAALNYAAQDPHVAPVTMVIDMQNTISKFVGPRTSSKSRSGSWREPKR